MKTIKRTVRKYYKYQTVESSWTQPVLSANGTLGGDSFACSPSSTEEYLNWYPAWKAFDNTNSTAWSCVGSTGHMIFYNPAALKVSSIKITNPTNNSGILNFHSVATAGNIQASNDSTNWIQIATYTNSSTTSGQTWTINVNSSNFYKYYKIEITSSSNNNNTCLAEVAITATKGGITIIEGTSFDYDFYEDEEAYLALKKVINGTEKYYALT